MKSEQLEMTAADRNVLREYINTESGKKLLLNLANQEVNNMAEAYNRTASLERQGQMTNQNAGIYWVRTFIESLITPPPTKRRE